MKTPPADTKLLLPQEHGATLVLFCQSVHELYGTENSREVIELTRNNDENSKPFSRGNTDNFLSAVGQPLGSLVKLHVGHDSSGEDPSWFLNEISITDIEGRKFPMEVPLLPLLALEREDGSTTVELYAPNVNKRHGFKSEFNSARICGLANDHLRFSVVIKEPRDFFTRVQRVTCCFFFFLWECFPLPCSTILTVLMKPPLFKSGL